MVPTSLFEDNSGYSPMDYPVLARLRPILSPIEYQQCQQLSSSPTQESTNLVALTIHTHLHAGLEKTLELTASFFHRPSFSSLNVGSPSQIPCLRALFSRTTTVKLEFAAYVATTPLGSVSDFAERAAAVRNLKSFLEVGVGGFGPEGFADFQPFLNASGTTAECEGSEGLSLQKVTFAFVRLMDRKAAAEGHPLHLLSSLCPNQAVVNGTDSISTEENLSPPKPTSLFKY